MLVLSTSRFLISAIRSLLSCRFCVLFHENKKCFIAVFHENKKCSHVSGMLLCIPPVSVIDLLVDFRGHEPVKLRVFREPVLEGHQCTPHLDQTASGIYIFDKIHLLTGDIDKLR